MKKNITNSHMNKVILTKAAKRVKRILEGMSTDELKQYEEDFFDSVDNECGCQGGDCDDKELSERRRINSRNSVNEMARPTTRTTIPETIWKSVRSAISHMKYDEVEASKVKPRTSMDHDSLVARYATALITFGKPCPQTEDEIDEIGVYSAYAHKILQMGGSLEEIEKMYLENGGQSDGTQKPASKPAVVNTPSNDGFNFNDDDDELPVDNGTDNKPVEGEDFPAYDDVDTAKDGDDDDWDFFLGGYDADDDDDDSADDDSVGDIGQIANLSYEDFYDASNNLSWKKYNSDAFHVNEEGMIGIDVQISDGDGMDEPYTTIIWRPNLGLVFEYVYIMNEANLRYTIACDNWFDVELYKSVNFVYSEYVNKIPVHNPSVDENIDKFGQITSYRIKTLEQFKAVVIESADDNEWSTIAEGFKRAAKKK